MAIKETEVWVKLNGKFIKFYENLGYEIPRKKDKWGDINFTQGSEILVKLEHVPKGSEVRVTKICDYCFEEVEDKVTYVSIIKGRKYINKDCCKKQECVKRKIEEINKAFPLLHSGKKSEYSVKTERSLLAKFPDIAADYHPTLNEKSPDHVSYGSDKPVWWICKVNPDHIWDDTPKHRTSTEKRGCPYCHGRRVNQTNCLSTLFPNIAKEWHPTLNGELTPDDVTKASGDVVWWLCPDCSNDYDMKISLRTLENKPQNCPYCRNLRVNETNCLATTDPKLAEEWCYERNNDLSPLTIVRGSKKKVWWKCNTCDHAWNVAPDTRTRSDSGCPKCSESKGEKRITKYLHKNEILNTSQYTFDDLTGVNGGLLRFDFAIFNKYEELECLVEYDGEYHYMKIFEDDNYETTQIHDKLKNEYCELHNIPLIRIPYWDFNNIEQILDERLSKDELHNALR